MAETTGIVWCDTTWNPWIGCTAISPACDHCYARAEWQDRRHRAVWGARQPRSRTSAANWGLPGRWERRHEKFAALYGRRRRVFCASLADWLDHEVPTEWLVDLLQLIHDTPHLDWLLLSKRIGAWRARIDAAGELAAQNGLSVVATMVIDWLRCRAPANVWIGATVCDQAEADRDLRKLIGVPAAVRFVSIEPMLGPITIPRVLLAPIEGTSQHGQRFIDWVICGGESGPHARPMHPDWARSLRDQCASAGVPFLFKQWGEWLPWHHFSDAAVDDPLEQTRFSTVEWREGAWIDVGRPDVWASKDGEIDDMQCMGRVGTKASGRLLDGREHLEFPS